MIYRICNLNPNFTLNSKSNCFISWFPDISHFVGNEVSVQPFSHHSLQKRSKYDQEIPQSHTADQPMALLGKSNITLTITRHQEDKRCKATSSFFPIKMIAKLQRTQSSAQHVTNTEPHNERNNQQQQSWHMLLENKKNLKFTLIKYHVQGFCLFTACQAANHFDVLMGTYCLWCGFSRR